MIYKTIFFDFNGVLSHDFFYRPLQKSHPKVWDFIQSHIFGPNGNELVLRWMRADVDLGYINKHISQQTEVDLPTLEEAVAIGGSEFAIDGRHFDLINRLKSKGIKVGLVTDNMDVFDLYINPHYQFEAWFDVVVNSFPFKKLKKEGLFDIAMKLIGSTDYSSTLLIEDSPRSISLFQSMGGNGFHYRNYEDFKIWSEKNLAI